MSGDYGVTICDCCGVEINCDEANDGSEHGYGTLCNECIAELEWRKEDNKGA